MKKIKNDRFIKALLRQPVDQTPIWIMRQAGRYLPEYRAVRQRVPNFLTLCQTPELACEVTLQPIRRFALDAAIVFSDILTIPDAMGLGLYFVEGEGPKFQKRLEHPRDIEQLTLPDISQSLSYTLETIRMVSRSLDGSIPLIGFSGSPWTLACYMIEGGSSKTFHRARGLTYSDPDTLQNLLNLLSQSVTEYLTAQAEAGANALMLFDTWGGLLTPTHYQTFSLYYLEKIIHSLKSQPHTASIPIILFTKQGGAWLQSMAQSGCDAIGLDWTVNIHDARQQVGNQVALQGNFDPALLFGTPECIRKAVKNLLAQYGAGTGHIANLGHGIEPATNPDHVEVLINAVHEFSKVYHA